VFEAASAADLIGNALPTVSRLFPMALRRCACLNGGGALLVAIRIGERISRACGATTRGARQARFVYQGGEASSTRSTSTTRR
jgi:hypothetical protein